MIPTWLLGGVLVAAPAWASALARIELGAPVDPRLARGAERIDLRTPGGPARALIAPGLLAALNRAGASRRDPAGRLDLSRYHRALRGTAPEARYLLLLDAEGRLEVAWFELAVPVDTTGEGPGFSPRRLRRLDDARRWLARFGLRVVDRGPRGHPFGWRGEGLGGRMEVRHAPARDTLSVLVHRP